MKYKYTHWLKIEDDMVKKVWIRLKEYKNRYDCSMQVFYKETNLISKYIKLECNQSYQDLDLDVNSISDEGLRHLSYKPKDIYKYKYPIEYFFKINIKGECTMEKIKFNRDLAKKILDKEKEFKIGEQVTFLYKNSWDITITKEEKKYSPFLFSINGKKIGTNETWSRRYIGIKEALLHIVNDFNENANIKDRYNNIEKYLNEKVKLTYKYEENGNYYYEDENENLYCENGNQNIGEVHLMYCTKDYGEPITAVEDLEKYELVNNPKNDPNYEKKEANKYNYMMLDRLRADCDYFLNNGNGFLGHLYYKDVDKHIEEMKKIYNSFSEEEKPEWINLKDIENYQVQMNEMLEKNSEEEI